MNRRHAFLWALGLTATVAVLATVLTWNWPTGRYFAVNVPIDVVLGMMTGIAVRSHR